MVIYVLFFVYDITYIMGIMAYILVGAYSSVYVPHLGCMHMCSTICSYMCILKYVIII